MPCTKESYWRIGEEEGHPLAYPPTGGLAGLGCSGHGAGDLAEDRADAGRNTRHDSARGNRHETGHQSVLNEVLASSVLPNSQLPNQICDPCHLNLLSLRRISSVAMSKLSSEPGTVKSVEALRTNLNSTSANSLKMSGSSTFCTSQIAL